MPRISMFLDSDFPPDPRVENEALSLIEKGFEIHLLSFSRDRRRKEFEVINGINVHRVHISTLIYKLSALAYSLPWYHRLIRKSIGEFINKTSPDFLHVHDMLMARAVFWANKGKLPVTLDLHENRPEIMQFYPHVQSILGRLTIDVDTWRRWQRKLVRNANRVITVTELAKRQLAKEAQVDLDKIVVVPNTIKKDVFYSYEIDHTILDRFSGKQVVLYLGDTGLRRGTDTAIEAIAKLKDHFPNILLVLVGRSTDDKALYALVRELCLEANVQFEGWQDLSLFPSYIEAATVTVSPLKRNEHHDTTYANKLFQYMARGKPLVVSNCPAQELLIKEINCGLIHRADDSDDLVTQISTLLGESELCATLGENGKKAVDEKYNWDYTSANLIKLYVDFTGEVN